MAKHQSKIENIGAPTMSRSGQRRWLYPDRRDGKYTRRRKITAIILIAIYLILPWLHWNDIPVFRFDVIEKKAFLFGQIFHMTDAAFIAPALVASALLLFFATSLKGRIWCAYSCPQTVFVEWVIRPIEEWIEGSSHRRKSQDSGPLTFSLLLRKALKHAIFIGVAAVVSNTFLSFFFGPERITVWMRQPPTDHLPQFLVMIFVLGVFYFDLAWFREQFCAYLCPYARFQSVIMDQDTPIVSFDSARGEPRSSKAKNPSNNSTGDCIDCQLCVRVCPTGIDIRNGHQLECIMCARCMDACDVIMKNLNRPTQLIKMASQNELQNIPRVPRFKRTKVLAYGFLLLLTLSLGLARITIRDKVSLDLIRAPGSTYTNMPENRYGNIFILRAINNTNSPIELDIQTDSPDSTMLLCAQCKTTIPAASELRLSAIVSFEPKAVNRKFSVKNRSTNDEASAVLIGPAQSK